MATHVLDQIPIINSRTNGDSAAFLVSTAAVRAEEKQQRRQVDVILMKSKRSNPAKRTTVTLSRTSGSNAVTLIFILTAALALLLVSVQLQQCRQRLLRKTSGETAGSTKRRLAEGGHEDNCTQEAQTASANLLKLVYKKEKARRDLERALEKAESARQAAESARQAAESARQAASFGYDAAESACQAAESARQAAESARQAARQAAESARQALREEYLKLREEYLKLREESVKLKRVYQRLVGIAWNTRHLGGLFNEREMKRLGG